MPAKDAGNVASPTARVIAPACAPPTGPGPAPRLGAGNAPVNLAIIVPLDARQVVPGFAPADALNLRILFASILATQSAIETSTLAALIFTWALGFGVWAFSSPAFAPVDAALETVPWTVSTSGVPAKRNFCPARKCPTICLLSLVFSLSSLPPDDSAPQNALELALMYRSTRPLTTVHYRLTLA
jgi:hypothetical protein